MLKSLPLIKGRITLSESLDNDDDILLELSYPEKRLDFYCYLYERREEIEAVTAFLLGISRAACRVGEIKEWIHGSFNACIPVYINSSAELCDKEKVIVRLPLPYKVGELEAPGNAEEKLRCEAATYIWIRNNCPTVPTPDLLGFGFTGGRTFLLLEKASILDRLGWYLRQAVWRLFGYPPAARFVSCTRPCILGSGYLLLDYVKHGSMLSESWATGHQDIDRRTNLFRDLSRIILLLAQVPLPRIGSFTIDNRGILSLTNRPLTLSLQQSENSGIPTDIARDQTYSCVDDYYADLIGLHDNRIWHQPNSILDQSDGEAQLSALTMMRALLHRFTNKDVRQGPFVFALTDLHQSNIFVDDNWHIISIIDLEWACVRPIEMLHPPYWLSGQALDHLAYENLQAYEIRHAEFLKAFELEERSIAKTVISNHLHRGWKVGNFWYFGALDCPKGLYSLFINQIQPMFADLDTEDAAKFKRLVAPHWHTKAHDIISMKLRQREEYNQKVQALFEVEGGNQKETYQAA